MTLRNRIGNSVFFIGLVLLVPAAMLLDFDAGLERIAVAIACLSFLLMAVGGWLWNTGIERSTGSGWDGMHPLKKFAWSTIVIIMAFLAAMAMIMLIGRA